jgi:site-specific DNA recombinase
MTGKIIRCAIYTRKSSEEGLEQGFNSLHAQREACEAYIKSQKHEGWQLVKTQYDDGGFSGGTMNRPALQLLMKDIEAGKIDVIVVYKVDRLSRSLHDFAKMVDIFDRHKVSFVSVTQQFNTTSSMGRLTLNVLLSFAQFEREVTGERIRDKIAASKKKGMWMGGPVPLGYDVVDRKLVINPVEAETVRHIFRRYLELGNVRQLQDELGRHGIVGKIRNSESRPGGAVYSRGALYHLLSNHVYIGQIAFKGVCHDGQHDGIINPELWDLVQKSLIDNKVGIVQNYRRTEAELLNDRLFDGVTGEALIPVHTSKKGRRYRYYVSQSLNLRGRGESAGGWRLPGPVIEKTVYGIIRSMLNDRAALITALTAADISVQYIPDVLAQVQRASQQQDQALDVFARRVAVRSDGVEVSISLASTLPENIERREVIIMRTMPMQMQRRGNEMRLAIRMPQTLPQMRPW